MITLFGKNMCESCFAENDKDPCEKCGFSSADYQQDLTALPIGHKLQERYLIGGVIGKGGFGITYIAFDTKLERRVAVKEYYPYGLALRTPGTTMVSSPNADADSVFDKGAEKFYDEARLVAKFSGNQNIVSIYDFFYENSTVYYVMEYLHGKSMKKYVETHGVVSAEQAVYIAKEVSNALVSSHSANVLHRDIAPDNIMLCNDGKVKLIDFGAARQVVSEGSQSLSAILKQGFAPLEQYQKKGKQGPWTDIYALGTTIYYLMTGELLDDPMTRMDDDEAFSSNKYNINDELWTIIKKATMLKPADRYKDIFEFRDALNKTSLGSSPLTISYDEPFKIEAAAFAKEASTVGETMPAKEAAPVGATMPAKEASPVGATMPAKEASPIGATMPVKNTSDMRTMPVYDSAPQGSDVPREADVSARNKFIPIISVLSAIIVVLVIGMIAVLLNNSDEAEIIADETDTETSAAYEETSLTKTTSVKTSASTEAVSERVMQESGQPPVTSVPDPAVSEPSQPDRSAPEQSEPSQPDRSEPQQSKPPQTSKTVTEPPKPAETTKPPAATTTNPPVTTTKPAVTKTANGEYVIAGKTFSGTETYMTIAIKDLSVTEELDQLANFKKLTSITLNFEGVSTKESENFDFSFLNNINNINVESLYFHYAPKNTFSQLKKFTNTKKMGFYDCDNLMDLSFLKGYNSLELIEIWHAPNLKDISGLEYVSSTITSVDFRHFGLITDISVLKKCSNITDLDIMSCPNIKNFDIISSLKKLKSLSICNCGLTKKSDYDFLYDISKKDNRITLLLGNDLSDKIFEKLKEDEKLKDKFFFVHADTSY